MYNANAVRAIVEADVNVFAVFNGHGHENRSAVVNNIKYFEVPSTTSASSYFVVDLENKSITVTGYGTASSYSY